MIGGNVRLSSQRILACENSLDLLISGLSETPNISDVTFFMEFSWYVLSTWNFVYKHYSLGKVLKYQRSDTCVKYFWAIKIPWDLWNWKQNMKVN